MTALNPYLCVTLAALIWGTSGAFVKFIALPAFVLGFMRGAIVLAVISTILIVKNIQPFHGPVKTMILAGGINALRTWLVLTGFLYASLGNGVIMLYTWPVFAALYGILFLGERLTVRKLFLLALALAGVVVIYMNRTAAELSDRELIGMTAMLLHGAFYAMTVVIFKKQGPHYSVPETLFYQNLMTPFLFFPFLFVTDAPFPSAVQIGWTAVFSLWIGILAFSLFFSGLRRIEAFSASLLTYLEIIGAIFFGIVFFGEALTWNIIVGGALIVGSTLMLRRRMDGATEK